MKAWIGIHWVRDRVTLDRLLLRQTLTPKDNLVRLINIRVMIFRLWEEARELREDPHTQREHANSVQKDKKLQSRKQNYTALTKKSHLEVYKHWHLQCIIGLENNNDSHCKKKKRKNVEINMSIHIWLSLQKKFHV